MANINIGTIYKTKIKKTGEGIFELALIGMTSPKSLEIIKYRITLSQKVIESEEPVPYIPLPNEQLISEQMVQGLEIAPDIVTEVLRKMSSPKELDLNHTIKSQVEVNESSRFKIEIEDSQDLSEALNAKGILPKDLVEIISLDPKYVVNALNFIGAEVIKRDFDADFIMLADIITSTLIGSLSENNSSDNPISTSTIEENSFLNPSIFLASLASEAALDEEYGTMGDAWEHQCVYISFLERIFKKCGVDVGKIELPYYGHTWEGENALKSIGFRNALTKNPKLVYEYLFSLSPTDIISFLEEIVSFFQDLKTTSKQSLTLIYNRSNQYDLTIKSLISVATFYMQTRPIIIAEDNKLTVKFQDGKSIDCDLNITPTTAAQAEPVEEAQPEEVIVAETLGTQSSKKKIAEALKIIASSKKIPEPIQKIIHCVLKLKKQE